MSLGPLEIIAIVLVILLLFGYKKLPDASRSLGRSLRIFKGEMKGMKDDDARESVRAKDPAQTSTPVRGEIVPPPAAPNAARNTEHTAQLQEEARIAEARAAEARARLDQSRTTDGPL
jgi:sec-independent protein translocase protein TatA